jgi:hypothetical protein
MHLKRFSHDCLPNCGDSGDLHHKVKIQTSDYNNAVISHVLGPLSRRIMLPNELENRSQGGGAPSIKSKNIHRSVFES